MMHIIDLYGKRVISKKFGEGEVLYPADKNNLYISYGKDTIKQGFPKEYPKYFRFVSKEADDYATLLSRMSALSSAKKMKDTFAEYRKNELYNRSKGFNPNGPALDMMGYSESSFLKFEGTTMNPDDILEINHIVDDDGKIKYLLNFSRVGENIKENDPFFICKGYGSELYIYGCGIVSAYKPVNTTKESWIKQHLWMKEKDKYVFVKECQILATELTNCPTLMSIYKEYGGKIFLSQADKDTNLEDLARIHNQKSHMFLTELGYEALTDIFNNYAVKHGAYMFETEY